MGSQGPADGERRLSLFLIDTTVLISHLRGVNAATSLLLGLLAGGHTLGVAGVNLAEVERGIRPKERKQAESLLARLRFLETTREAATRAGRYQADFARHGVTIHTADAPVAGTARAHGAIVVTDNVREFPKRDVRIEAPPRA